MKFFLLERVLNSEDQIAITGQEFEDIRKAKLIALETLAIEEKYYLLLQNYFDFEKSLHDHALSSLLFRDYDWSDKVDDVHSINKSLINLLSAGKMYVDHIPQHLNTVFDPSLAESEEFVTNTNIQYDSSFGYRVLAALRNHTQHSDFPVQSLTYNMNWINFTGKRLCRHSATANIHVDTIARNKKFKPTNKAELEAIGEKVDIKPIVRQYMSSFSVLHKQVRTALKPTSAIWDRKLTDASTRFRNEFSRDAIGLHATSIDVNGEFKEQLSIFTDVIDRRLYLERRATTIGNLYAHFISGDIG
jgi:hypothetical protein